MRRSAFSLSVLLGMALTLLSCATAPTEESSDQNLGKGALIIVFKEIKGETLFLQAASVESSSAKFKEKGPGFFMNLGDVPYGILPAVFSNYSVEVPGPAGEDYMGTYKNLPAGKYVFMALYDETRSTCFHERSKVFDVKPDFVNIVVLPPSKGFLKKGFFKSVPETPPVDWDYSADVSDAELLEMYETVLKDAFKLDQPVRVSEVTYASFEPRSKPALSYLCFLPEDMTYSVLNK